MYKYKKLTLTQ